MIVTKPKHIFLYLVGMAFLIFGNRQYWAQYQDEKEAEQQQRELAERASVESHKSFEIQKMEYDSLKGVWANKHISFIRVHVGPVQFGSTSPVGPVVETNDEEYASDSF